LAGADAIMAQMHKPQKHPSGAEAQNLVRHCFGTTQVVPCYETKTEHAFASKPLCIGAIIASDEKCPRLAEGILLFQTVPGERSVLVVEAFDAEEFGAGA
jgi:hypothetical protein